jgi:hypothetical protein
MSNDKQEYAPSKNVGEDNHFANAEDTLTATGSHASSNLYPAVEQLEEMERIAREEYLSECLENFKFYPQLSNPQRKTGDARRPVKRETEEDENEGIRDLKLLHSMITKRFNGKPEDLQIFLDQINNANELCATSQRRNLLALIFNAIEGEPRETLRERPDIRTYSQLVTFLKEHYEPRESFAQAYSRLSAAKQEHNETIRQFGDRLLHLAYLAKNASRKEKKLTEETILENGILKTIPSRAATHMIEFTALERFKVGSKIEISRYIRCHPYADTLSKAIHEAVEFEAKEFQEKSFRNNTRSGTCHIHGQNSGHSDKECRMQQHKKTSTEKYCSYCKIPGHLRMECRKRQRDEEYKRPSQSSSSTLAISCGYCKKNGHIVRDCKLLEKRKKENPARYDQNHPNYKGPQRLSSDTLQSSMQSSSSTSKPTGPRQINLCTKNQPVTQFTSPSSKSPNLQLLIDGGAEESIIKNTALNEEICKNIDRSRSSSMLRATTSFKTIGTVPIRAYINGHTFEFDFLVLDDPSINIPFDGLIGDDILQAMRVIIDYNNYILKFKAWETNFPFSRSIHSLHDLVQSSPSIHNQPN